MAGYSGLAPEGADCGDVKGVTQARIPRCLGQDAARRVRAATNLHQLSGRDEGAQPPLRNSRPTPVSDTTDHHLAKRIRIMTFRHVSSLTLRARLRLISSQQEDLGPGSTFP
jgi:hypothetical protein